MEGQDEPTGRRQVLSGPDRRRFRIAALLAMGVGAVPYLWILWAGRLDPLRSNPSGYFSNFYELQARALFNGRWDVPRGSLGIEGFIVNGQEYTYFGPLPAFLRMPVMAITDTLDGRMTTVSMLLAWVLTGLFASMLIWQIRAMIRGTAPLSRLEAVATGVLIAGITTGSAILTLAAIPAVYYEAEAWGVALAIGSLWALLGVLDEPSTRHVTRAGVLISATTLSRLSLGWACVIGALLVALWFATGRDRRVPRTVAIRVLIVAVMIPLAVGGAVSWQKFGNAGVLPMENQVFTAENEHRQMMLAANDGEYYRLQFVPTNSLLFFRPDALHFSAVYPFVTMPTEASPAVGGAVLDLTHRTTSIPSSMPLLVLLSMGGMFAMIRRRRDPWTRLVAIPLIAGAAGCVPVLMSGYTAQRYLNDFLPLLAVASAIGLVAGWGWVEGRSRRFRSGVVSVMGLLALFGLIANLGVAIETAGLAADGAWARGYVENQLGVADLLGRPPEVERRQSLPRSGPPGQVVIVGDCAGLYLATGEDHYPQWQYLDYGPGQRHLLDLTYREIDGGPLRLLDLEPETILSIEDRGLAFVRYMRFRLEDVTGERRVSPWIEMEPGQPYRVEITADPGLDRIRVVLDGEQVVQWSDLPLASGGTPVVQDDRRSADIVWREVPEPSLCRELSEG